MYLWLLNIIYWMEAIFTCYLRDCLTGPGDPNVNSISYFKKNNLILRNSATVLEIDAKNDDEKILRAKP